MEVRPSLDQILDSFPDELTKQYIDVFTKLANHTYSIKGPTLKGLIENRIEYILTSTNKEYEIILHIVKKDNFYDVLELNLELNSKDENRKIATRINFDTGDTNYDFELDPTATSNLYLKIKQAHELLKNN
jgi:hypothetical protein